MMRRIDVVADWVILGLSDAVCQPVVLVPPLVAEELSLHRDAAEVTVILITPILAVVSASSCFLKMDKSRDKVFNLQCGEV